MITIQEKYRQIDSSITAWMIRNGITLLRLCLGTIFFWFGILKFFPGMSPAQDLAVRTMDILTFNMIPAETAIILLALWECLIGAGLIVGVFLRTTLLLLFVQMFGTITPLLFFPNETFILLPFAPTMEGQYIIKNLVLISAGIVIGSTVRGGRVTEEKGK